MMKDEGRGDAGFRVSFRAEITPSSWLVSWVNIIIIVVLNDGDYPLVDLCYGVLGRKEQQRGLHRVLRVTSLSRRRYTG